MRAARHSDSGIAGTHLVFKTRVYQNNPTKASRATGFFSTIDRPMTKSPTLLLALLSAILLWFLNYIALIFHFYWTVIWYDIMMHFLGGLTIGVFLLAIFKIANISTKAFSVLFALAMAISVGWEIFEYVNEIIDTRDNYVLDTTYDLIMDALGIVTAYFIVSGRSLESF